MAGRVRLGGLRAEMPGGGLCGFPRIPLTNFSPRMGRPMGRLFFGGAGGARVDGGAIRDIYITC